MASCFRAPRPECSWFAETSYRSSPAPPSDFSGAAPVRGLDVFVSENAPVVVHAERDAVAVHPDSDSAVVAPPSVLLRLSAPALVLPPVHPDCVVLISVVWKFRAVETLGVLPLYRGVPHWTESLPIVGLHFAYSSLPIVGLHFAYSSLPDAKSAGTLVPTCVGAKQRPQTPRGARYSRSSHSQNPHAPVAHFQNASSARSLPWPTRWRRLGARQRHGGFAGSTPRSSSHVIQCDCGHV